jgi:signal transduction histidine kinase
LLAAASIPVLLFADWIAYNAADNQRASAIVLAHDTVDRVGEWITAEMTNQVQVAEALALSPSLDDSDFTSFYREARTLKAARALWFTVELDDLQGMQVLNLLRPLGDQLGPTADRESFEEVLRDQKPVIGSIGPVGVVSGRHLVALRIPVIRDRALRYVLTIEMAPDAVSGILRKAGLPYGWIGAVVDRHGNLVARSLSEDENLGRSAGPSLNEAIGKSAGGVYKGRTLEGIPVDTIFRTLQDVGMWSVHLGIPSDTLNGPVRHAFYAVAAGVAGSLTIATALTAIVAKGIALERQAEGQRSAAALSASESRADLAIEAAGLGTWGWDFEQDRITGSERCRLLLDLPHLEEGQKHWSSSVFLGAVHPDDLDRVRTSAQGCLHKDTPFDVDFRVLRKDGAPRWLRLRGQLSVANEEGATALYGIVMDVGAQKLAEAQRLSLLRRLADAQEDVQRRIAHDLHDQVGQTVTGLSLGLKALERAVERVEEPVAVGEQSIKERMRWLQKLTTEIGRDIHQASADLRPTALDDLGLPRALAALIADWNERYGVAADVQIMGPVEPRLPAELETVLYRVVQEALTNVLKHAKASNVSIVLDRRLDYVRVVIEDDGSGFDVDESGGDRNAEPRDRQGLGLLGMRERLAMIGGALRVESSNAGTTLFVTIPLDPHRLAPEPL